MICLTDDFVHPPPPTAPPPLTSTSPAHKYYLAMDPRGEVLYVSDTSSRRVYRVRNLGQPKDPSRNLEVVAGTGEQCLPFDQSHCGEGRKATEAALNNPRGRNTNKVKKSKWPQRLSTGHVTRFFFTIKVSFSLSFL